MAGTFEIVHIDGKAVVGADRICGLARQEAALGRDPLVLHVDREPVIGADRILAFACQESPLPGRDMRAIGIAVALRARKEAAAPGILALRLQENIEAVIVRLASAVARQGSAGRQDESNSCYGRKSERFPGCSPK